MSRKPLYAAWGSVSLMLGLLVGFAAAKPWLDLRIVLNLRADVPGADTLEVRFPELAEVFNFRGPVPASADSVLDVLLAQANAATPPSRPRSDGNYRPYVDTGANPLFLNPAFADGGFALEEFFLALRELERGADTLVRVAHCGDSQIEGDRISRYVRDALQQRFGGNGLGLVPFADIASHHYITRGHVGVWRRYNVFSDPHRSGRYNLGGLLFKYGEGYGPAGSPARPRPDSARPPLPAPAQPETTPNAEPAPAVLQGGVPQWFAVAQPPDSPPTPAPRPGAGAATLAAACTFRMNGASWNRARLLLGPVRKPLGLKLSAGAGVLLHDSVRVSTDIQLVDLPAAPSAQTLKLEFSGTESPEILGLLLDGRRGVQVDNFGIRGHTGGGLLSINNAYLAQQYALLNTKLIILQFGGNAVPSTQIYNWSFFEDEVYRMVRHIQRAAPHASILVVGVGDAAHRVEGGFRTYHTVPRIRDAQRRAAQRAGVAFWDLYQAMGGQNAIVAWVQRGLAGQDFAHFSTAGQRLVGNMLVRTLLEEYDLWLAKNP